MPLGKNHSAAWCCSATADGGDIPDPIARALEGLLDEVQTLRARVNALEGGADASLPAVDPRVRVENNSEDADKSPKGEC